MYAVTTPERHSLGLNVGFVAASTPGVAAKTAVEESVLPAGRVIVFNLEDGTRTVWDVKETKIVYAYEVRE